MRWARISSILCLSSSNFLRSCARSGERPGGDTGPGSDSRPGGSYAPRPPLERTAALPLSPHSPLGGRSAWPPPSPLCWETVRMLPGNGTGPQPSQRAQAEVKKMACLRFQTETLPGQRGFPGGPRIKNPPCNAGDSGSIPGLGTQIPHAAGPLSPHATTTRVQAPQLETHASQLRACSLQLRLNKAK